MGPTGDGSHELDSVGPRDASVHHFVRRAEDRREYFDEATAPVRPARRTILGQPLEYIVDRLQQPW